MIFEQSYTQKAGECPGHQVNNKIRVFIENKSSRSDVIFFTAIFLFLAMISIFYLLYGRYLVIPPAGRIIFSQVAQAGFISIVGLPLFATAAIFPRKLIVDDQGLTYRKWGLTEKMSWNEITNILVRNDAAWVGQAGPQLRYQMITSVVGNGKTISWEPIFEISPELLADYLKQRLAEMRRSN